MSPKHQITEHNLPPHQPRGPTHSVVVIGCGSSVTTPAAPGGITADGAAVLAAWLDRALVVRGIGRGLAAVRRACPSTGHSSSKFRRATLVANGRSGVGLVAYGFPPRASQSGVVRGLALVSRC